ncbi:cell wall metabolism sensor histidine kinase WalK [Peribacillus castrilensis]|jgi:two-component system, OmpR family, sensor histidine kinase VicK|uniref:histidine kinase n=2 Tax=Peribacillus TaxID=2675229 RepID=A0AAN2PCH7_9BACI|nr:MULTISPECIES: cell wall metabolism sensor histidine kinase WalK [Bacillaceae]MCD1160778.1 cell wall metabolism sensor histidine kinase WalK [Peribacillus castrilensis]MBD8589653.1 cell wall metabolism sensor histidine kinase WalK [Peribacillus simplex]MCF7625386.1 cell wall metabolism sensor histidine kinase WalK [Peribacillus frigoritolerans]MCP1155922.1 cell wall metabolism sensor histidine kinase WalK [Peribacillus frigoritolerans]MCT1387889.1 cell wall metabolism sensor histidine kinase
MKKVGFFRSIHFKFVLIYVLLIFVAMQIIGVYFVGELEENLVGNFTKSIKGHVNLLTYSIGEEMEKERGEEDPTLEEAIDAILKDRDNSSNDISEVRVIDTRSRRVIGTSAPGNQDIVGKKTTEVLIKNTLTFGKEDSDVFRDKKTGRRLWVLSTPVEANGEVIGAVYVIAEMENVFEQMDEINSIFMTGTAIALVITAILGILLARTITRPMSDMRKQALVMAKGNFSRKVRVYGDDEIGQLAVTFNNLTKKLQESQSSTEGERRKLSSVLANMTDGVISTDRRGRVNLINEPAAQLLNVSSETVMNQPIIEVLGLEEEYKFEDLLEERESIILDYSKKNRPFILRGNFSVIQKETGFVNGLITVLHDITEQEKIESERREFVANVSHELRTPLTTMRSYLEALAEGAWKDEEIAPSFLSVTQNETERMIRLVNDLLQLSKMDSKDYRLKTGWVNFNKFYDHIIDRFEMSKNDDITFKRDLPKEAYFVDIDEDKITQVLYNVISNSLKYSPEGGQVTFRVRASDGFIIVSITDQGVGIPKNVIDKIFDRFYRVDKARARNLGGTGLGLAIAKEMVVAHGGKIWAESVDGKGTTVFFTLPYEQEEEDDWS